MHFQMILFLIGACWGKKRRSNATIFKNYQEAIEGIQISFSLYLNVYVNEVSYFIVHVLKILKDSISWRAKCFIKQNITYDQLIKGKL